MLALPNVEHIRKKAQDVVEAMTDTLDLIVCDMNIHPDQTTQICKDAIPMLKKGGTLLMTMKFNGTANTVLFFFNFETPTSSFPSTFFLFFFFLLELLWCILLLLLLLLISITDASDYFMSNVFTFGVTSSWSKALAGTSR